MESYEIRKEVDIDATLEAVWPFVSTGAGLSQWYGDATSVEMAPVAGGHYVERGADYSVAGHVLYVAPPAEIAISVRLETPLDATWPVYTRLSFHLTMTENGTQVTLQHTGFENLPEAYRVEMYKRFKAEWETMFPWLAEVAEGERG